jgi:hypothetical protein
MKINAHYDKHISYLVIEMEKFNVPQSYIGYCYYLKSNCSNFDKVQVVHFILLTPCNGEGKFVFEQKMKKVKNLFTIGVPKKGKKILGLFWDHFL